MNKRKIDYQIAYKNMRTLAVVLLCLFFGTIFLAGIIIQSTLESTVKECTKNTVTALEMTASCMTAGNVTQQQVVDKYYEMFIRPRFNQTGETK